MVAVRSWPKARPRRYRDARSVRTRAACWPGSSRSAPMAHDLVCWKCGAALAALSLPLRRLDECPQCREPTVEEVRDKTRANFCDHFKPRAGAWSGGDGASTERARSELDKLFGK